MIRSAAGRPAACPAYLAGRRGGDLGDLDLLWLAAYFRYLLGQASASPPTHNSPPHAHRPPPISPSPVPAR